MAPKWSFSTLLRGIDGLVTGKLVRKLFGAERGGKQLAQTQHVIAIIDEQPGPACLHQKLTTSATGHERITFAADRAERDKTALPLLVKSGYEAALSAQGESVRGVFDVATDNDLTAIGQRRGAHL